MPLITALDPEAAEDDDLHNAFVVKGAYAVWADDGKTLLFLIHDYRLGDDVADIRKLRELLQGV